MPNTVYWADLSREDQSAVLTEAIRNGTGGGLGYITSLIGTKINFVFEHRCHMFSRCGKLQFHAEEVLGVSSVYKGMRVAFFDLVFSRDDLDPDLSRFWGFDMDDKFVEAFEPVLGAIAARVPFEDLEWPDGLDLDGASLNSFGLEEISFLFEDFSDRVSAGDPCDLSTWKKSILAQVDCMVCDLLFFGDRLCRFDITGWVEKSFLPSISVRPYHCSFLDCNITVRG